MSRILVTGGGGFVGQAVVQRLLARGDEVLVVGRQDYPLLQRQGAMLMRGDIRDGQFLQRATRGCDAVIHVAAKAGIWGKRQEYFSINLEGTKRVLEGCLANGVQVLVHTSTPSVVFADHDLAGVDEGVPYARRFLCHYAHSKALAEQVVLSANGPALRTVALRPHLVWGPGDTNLIPRLLVRGRQGLLRQVGDGTNLVDIAYIDNVAEAHLLALDNLRGPATAAGKAYFISQGEPVRLWQWINDLFSRLGMPRVSDRVPFGLAYLVGAVLEAGFSLLGRQEEPRMTRFLAQQLAKSHWFSIAAARRDLGYVPRVSTEEGMQRLVDWLGQEGRE